MIEVHPYGAFIPPNAKYLILGSFPGKESGDWFYGSKRNQFWQILEQVYNLPLKSKAQKIELFTKLQLAISDVIFSCEREKGSNLDNNLINITYNLEIVNNILETQKIQTIFFSSRFVEATFKKKFKHLLEGYPDLNLVTLPSPSPRFASLSLKEKINQYHQVLPK